MSSLNNRLAVAAFFAAIATTCGASADEVDRCVAASEKGQKERRAGHLSDARASFLQCAADKCPSVVRAACSEWLDQVNASLPTIVVAVTDPAHKDIVDAKIEVDGKAAALGRAVPLDPGPHTVAVEAEGFQSATQSIVAREAERNRAIAFTLTKKVSEPAPPPPPPPEKRSSISTITWVTGGLTVVALGSFVGFGLRGRSLAAQLREECKPNCSDDARGTAATSYVIADVSLIAAVILGGVTLYTYLTSRD